MPSKYGFGNTRKKSPYEMGKAHYGKDQKNPIMMESPLERDKTTTKEKAKAVLGTIADTFTANEPITAMGNISRTYKQNKAYQRALSAKKEKN